MVERGQDFGFTLEARQSVGVVREASGRTLMATARFRFVSVARYTSPMPPAPSWSRLGTDRVEPGPSGISEERCYAITTTTGI